VDLTLEFGALLGGATSQHRTTTKNVNNNNTLAI
jgi:hypothetical protein